MTQCFDIESLPNQILVLARNVRPRWRPTARSRGKRTAGKVSQTFCHIWKTHHLLISGPGRRKVAAGVARRWFMILKKKDMQRVPPASVWIMFKIEWLIHCLIDWSIDRLTDWLFDCLTACFIVSWANKCFVCSFLKSSLVSFFLCCCHFFVWSWGVYVISDS